MSVTLMLRPSLIIWRMAGTPSAVAGIFTNRLGASIRPCSARAASMLASVSWASAGATSRDTNPSVPPLDSYSGRNTASALVMSSMTSSQYASSTDIRAVRERNWSS